MRYRLFAILSAFLMLAACESYDCSLYNYVGCYGVFYKDGATVAIKDTLTITSGKKGPVLLNRGLATSKLTLSLSYWQDVDTLVFTVKGTDYSFQDTVWITKTNQVHYESPDCPTKVFHTITEVRNTQMFIKEINIIRSSVNYEQTTNLEIHLLSDAD